jgi:hypothetical protein
MQAEAGMWEGERAAEGRPEEGEVEGGRGGREEEEEGEERGEHQHLRGEAVQPYIEPK